MAQDVITKQVGYLHFPKTAGTTLGNAILGRVKSRIAVSSWRDAVDADLASHQFIHGHLLYHQLEETLGDDGFMMTNFRHPIERIYSLYRFRRRRPEDPEHEAAMSMSLAEYVEEGHGSQTYLHQLTSEVVIEDGKPAKAVPSMPDRESRMKLAKERIDSFDHVGISEYFDYSMLLLAHDLEVTPFWSATTMNTAPSPTTRKELDEDTIKTILRVASADIALYNYALERFKREVQKLIGADA